MALFDKLKSKLGIGHTENPAEPDKKEEKAVPEAPKAESVAPAIMGAKSVSFANLKVLRPTWIVNI